MTAIKQTKRTLFIATGMALASASAVYAEVKPNSLFAHNAILQRDQVLPVWGTARDGEAVSVEFAGQKVSTVARDGKWLVRLKPLKANAAAQTLVIRGDNTVTLTNLVVGDVWVASGQSNMERQLGPRPGQKLIANWEAEVAAANHPLIREYYVPEHLALAPAADAGGQWRVCSPQTVADFCAVGYSFARDVHAAEKIPVGVLFAAWGGTVAEAWTSAESLATMSDFTAAVEQVRHAEDPKIAAAKYTGELARWYAANDPGAEGKGNWMSPDYVASDWKPVNAPYLFDADFDGVMWFRREIQLPESWAGQSARLSLGILDDFDTTWVNGVRVGATENWSAARLYQIAPGVLKPGRNVIAVRILDSGGNGGFLGQAESLKLELSGGPVAASISLAGEWLSQKGSLLWNLPAFPKQVGSDPNSPTVLYNAMIAPLQPFPIKGAIWYQGEANEGRTKQYQSLFPLLISDWRRAWGVGDFPFLFVQIAPYRDLSPELREAQLLTLKKSPRTAMVVTADIGDANDIHPTRKMPVGARLALAARVLAYGEKLEYSGPLFESMTVKEGRAMLSFTHVGGGLMAKEGELKGFTIAGADKKFVPAKAGIVGTTVVVWSEQIQQPSAVRYGWANVPEVNLFNQAGLPASPFRTDVE